MSVVSKMCERHILEVFLFTQFTHPQRNNARCIANIWSVNINIYDIFNSIPQQIKEYIFLQERYKIASNRERERERKKDITKRVTLNVKQHEKKNDSTVAKREKNIQIYCFVLFCGFLIIHETILNFLVSGSIFLEHFWKWNIIKM